MVSVLSDFAGYETNVCFFKPKLAPAWGEQSLLAQISGTELHPPQPSDVALPMKMGWRCGASLPSVAVSP
jgi:hypothetical protein